LESITNMMLASAIHAGDWPQHDDLRMRTVSQLHNWKLAASMGTTDCNLAPNKWTMSQQQQQHHHHQRQW